MTEQEQLALFEQLAALESPQRTFKRLEFPRWTEDKARLIQQYLFYFVLVTKHGTYIDAFAGPQNPRHLDKWAAKRVLEIRPRLMRDFYLFEKNQRSVEHLRSMVAALPPREKTEPKRNVEIVPGDSNVELRRMLAAGEIHRKHPAFALLDQRTFECEWATVKALASYKPEYKIEIFYFLPISWLDRAFSGVRQWEQVERWWGRSDYWKFAETRNSFDRSMLMKGRFESELGYKYVQAWPIHNKDSRRLMYYMIHASDHPEATPLMLRAYRKRVSPLISDDQIALESADLERFLVEVDRARSQPETSEGDRV